MEGYYKDVLEKLGIAELISMQQGRPLREDLVKDYVLKSIFYSTNEEDAHAKSSASLILGGHFVGKDGMFPDYIEMSHADRVLDALKGFVFEDRPITSADVIATRSLLLYDIFSNSKHIHGLRRYRLSNGPHVTVPPDGVKEALDEIVRSLNRRHDSPINAFLEAVDFSLKYVDLHPFEDGNGRTTRLFTNMYLLKNGILPAHVSMKTEESYMVGAHPYYLAGYSGFFATTVLLMVLDKEGTEKLKRNLDRLSDDSPHELEIKDNIRLSLGLINSGTLKADMRRLYDAGMKEDLSLAFAALWLAGHAKIDGRAIDTPIVLEAYHNDDPRVRTLAVHAMGTDAQNFRKYLPYIEKALLDSDASVREQAVMQFSYNKALTSDLALKILTTEREESVLIAAGKAYSQAREPGKDPLAPVRMLLANGSQELRLRGYQSFVAHASGEEISVMLRSNMHQESDVIKKEIVVELSRTGKLNLPEVAPSLASLAQTDEGVRVPLLGELSLAPNISKWYTGVLDFIIRSPKLPEAERAYAIHLLGRERGFPYLAETYDLSGRSILEKMAGIVSYTNSLDRALSEGGAVKFIRETRLPFDLNDDTLKFVVASEFSRLSNGNGRLDKVLHELSRNGFAELKRLRHDSGTGGNVSILKDVVMHYQQHVLSGGARNGRNEDSVITAPNSAESRNVLSSALREGSTSEKTGRARQRA